MTLLPWTILAFVVIAGGAATASAKLDESPAFCATVCHKVMAPYVENHSSGTGLARVHKEAGVTCLDCHEATINDRVNEAIAYVSGDYKTPLVQRKFEDAMCLKCHGSMVSQANKTDLLLRNPHANPHQTDVCSTCHKSHTPQVDYCAKCHPNGGQRMITFPLRSHETTG